MARVLKKGMSINCRTEEEKQIFLEFAHKEGHRWAMGTSLMERDIATAPCSFQIEYGWRKFPDSISKSHTDFHDKCTPIEASVFFHNQLIARRIKNGRT